METNLWGALDGRSTPLFWVSAIAVAAGASGLLAGLLLLGSRLARRRRRARPGAASPAVMPASAVATPIPAPLASAAAGLRAYQAQGGGETIAPSDTSPAESGVEPGEGAGRVRLTPLLARLRTAAGRLEELAQGAEPYESESTADSSLKTLTESVEYVFRAGA